MLEIQNKLRSGFSLEFIKQTFGVRSRQYDDGRLLLKYIQWDTKGWKHPETKECRGLILDKNNYYNVVSYPFYKFFNHFESHAAPINWANARAYEKFDGTCIVVYYFNDNWCWGTLGTADGEAEQRFFYKLAKPHLDPILPKLNKQFGYVFELCTPLNRIITRYPEPEFRLLMVRNLCYYNYPEIDIDLFDLPKPSRIKVSSLEEVIALAEDLPDLREGYVVYDGFDRIKVKSAKYFAAFRMCNDYKTSSKDLAVLALKDDGVELLHFFPEFTEQYNFWKNGFDKLELKVKEFYTEHSELDRKQFAASALKALPRAAWIAFELFDSPEREIRDIISSRMEKNPKAATRHLELALKK